MKIAQYRVSMASEHTYTRQASRTETVRAWVGEQRPDFAATDNGDQNAASSTRVAISDAARQAIAAGSSQQSAATRESSATQQADAVDAIGHDAASDPKLELLIRIVEALTGRKVRIMDAGEIGRLASADKGRAHAAGSPGPAGGSGQPQGWGVEYDYHESLYESEQTSFTSSGEILTADGKRLQFDITLQMSREYRHETSISLRAGDAERKDPLVINFNGAAAELTGQKFDFDIDADGRTDRISFVGSASGLLALDSNGNGRIDDGHELFGARTGDGFAELAAYDEDGNGWIDESDSIFARLLIWTKDSSGADQLSTLAERHIGALYLGRTATPFDLKDSQNNQHGQILSSGIYLSEEGRPGTLQQLDLFV